MLFADFFVASRLDHPSIIRSLAHVDFNHKYLDNIRFVEVNNLPAASQHLIAIEYVDDAKDETTLVWNIKNTDPNNHSLSNISQITLSSEPTYDNHAGTKSHVDSSPKNDRNRQQMSKVFNDQVIDFEDKDLKPSDSITANWIPCSHSKLSVKENMICLKIP